MENVLVAPGSRIFPDADPRGCACAEGLPLRLVSEGEWARVISIQGRAVQDRLSGMGIHPGVQVRVESNPGDGSLLVSVDGTRLFLGGGMAQKIRVAIQHGGVA